jgi:uncharacterized protein (TIGR02453 family)
MAEPRPHFSQALFTFLVELSANNNRDWFAANKSRYERDVKDALVGFMTDLGPRLREFAPNFVVDPRPVGGSMFRIHRDTRFSKDKTPYKTAASAHFRHAATTKDVHMPGLYLHLEPGEVMVGAGLWQPEATSLAAVRNAIAEKPEAWAAAKGGVSLWGDSLKRVPAGFPVDHRHADDLRRKDFVGSVHFDEAAALDPNFLGAVVEAYRGLAPLTNFLTQIVCVESANLRETASLLPGSRRCAVPPGRLGLELASLGQ